jgi:hypothetical protein
MAARKPHHARKRRPSLSFLTEIAEQSVRPVSYTAKKKPKHASGNAKLISSKNRGYGANAWILASV